MDNYSLSNRRVLVTGISSGIGAAVAQTLGQTGAELIGLSRKASQLSQVELNQALDVDLSDLASLETALNKIEGPIDTLVLSAGYGQFGGIEQFSRSQIESLITVNLTANILICKHFFPEMKRAGRGDIVLLGSESALQGGKAGAVYCASKFGLRGFAQSLRADSSNGIRIIQVNPGPVATPFFDELNFEPVRQENFALHAADVANAIVHAISQPPHVVVEEINLQPLKRSFVKKS